MTETDQPGTTLQTERKAALLLTIITIATLLIASAASAQGGADEWAVEPPSLRPPPVQDEAPPVLPEARPSPDTRELPRAPVDDEKLPFAEPRSIDELPATALIETTQGPIEIEFYRREAPLSVRNFEYLTKRGVYDGVKFHHLIAGWAIQGGDPTGTGKGGPGYTLPPEISAIHHQRGTIGWARLPNEVNQERRSNGSQFYICLRRSSHLDGLYTVFAHVVAGIENAEKLREGDKIVRVRLPRERSERRVP